MQDYLPRAKVLGNNGYPGYSNSGSKSAREEAGTVILQAVPPGPSMAHSGKLEIFVCLHGVVLVYIIPGTGTTCSITVTASCLYPENVQLGMRLHQGKMGGLML